MELYLHKLLRYDETCVIISASMNETRRQRFKRLATRRVNKALNQLRVLGNLANRSYYEYNEDDINKMFKTMDSQLKAVKGKFHTRPKKFRM